jgi:hypothetical protein
MDTNSNHFSIFDAPIVWISLVVLQPPAHAGAPLADSSTLNMEAICSSETSFNARSTQRHIPEDEILHFHRCESLKSYKWTNVHDEGQSGRPSVVSDDFFQNIDKKNCERWRFTISELSYEFPQISRTLLYEIIIVRRGNHKFCARWVPKMLTGTN